MKRKMVLLPLVVLLLVVLSASAVVAEKPDWETPHPHPGGCVAHCARTPKADRDGDGFAGNCLVDLKCHKWNPTEMVWTCGVWEEKNDGNLGWCTTGCQIAHGQETHGRGRP